MSTTLPTTRPSQHGRKSMRQIAIGFLGLFLSTAAQSQTMEEKLCIFGAAQKLPNIQGLTIAASRTRAAAAPEAAKILVESFGNPVTAAEQLDRTFGFFLTPAAMEALTAALVERLKGSVIVDIDVRAAAQTATFTFICAWGAGTAVFAVPTGMSR